jgi:hypothetical protein
VPHVKLSDASIAETDPGVVDTMEVQIAMTDDARRALVAQIAYLRAERRNFAPGGEVEDWLAAEAEVSERLRGR